MGEPPLPGEYDSVSWEAWTPQQVAARLEVVDVPWCVSGGWAIDVLVCGAMRPHHDLEIAVPRADFPAIRRALRGFDVFAVSDGAARLLPAGSGPPIGRIRLGSSTARRWSGAWT